MEAYGCLGNRGNFVALQKETKKAADDTDTTLRAYRYDVVHLQVIKLVRLGQGFLASQGLVKVVEKRGIPDDVELRETCDHQSNDGEVARSVEVSHHTGKELLALGWGQQ